MNRDDAPRPWRCPRTGCPSSTHDTYVGYHDGCRSGAAGLDYHRYAKALRLGTNTPRTVPATGTRRRIRALQALGWRHSDIAEAAGLNAGSLQRLVREQSVYVATRDAITRAYDALGMTLGPSEHTRRLAVRRGWAPPLGWDDDTIDDPDIGPVLEAQVDYRIERAAGRAEKVADLTRAGLTATQIAEDLGVAERTVNRLRARTRNEQEAA